MSSTSKARQRILSLLDANSFVEIGAMVKARATDFNTAPAGEASDGVITGYGLIDGRLVYVYGQNADILGGSIGEMHAKKIVGLYRLAMRTGARAHHATTPPHTMPTIVSTWNIHIAVSREMMRVTTKSSGRLIRSILTSK